MKLIEHFNTFLDQAVNLNADRLRLLDESANAIKNFIRDSDWGPRIKCFLPQGSWAHKTIIKPLPDREFDADLLVMVAPYGNWGAKDYIDELYKVFKASGVYKDKVRRYSHCVTIEYARERRMDIAPCLVIEGDDQNYVCNRNANTFEASRPQAYTEWITERNAWTGRNGLKKVTRLVKYLRDIKRTFSCESIVLTTLLGIHVFPADQDSDELIDVPTSLRTLIGRLDDTLQSHALKPSVVNPVLPSEVFNEKWDETQYGNFRAQIHRYRTWIDDAFLESDRDASIAKWRKIFGDDFAKDVVLTEAQSVASRAILKVQQQMGSVWVSANDIIGILARFGARAIPDGLRLLPYVERPSWRMISKPLFEVRVVATLHKSRGGPRLRTINDLTPLPKHFHVRFEARTALGGFLGHEFRTVWRVTNTDYEAAMAGCLRGKFYQSDEAHVRWESLEYRGLHFVEAFIIRKRDKVCVAKSPPVYVVIE